MKLGSSATSPDPADDVLAHLPTSTVEEYRKSRSIYGPDSPSTNIYLVLSGKVKLSRMTKEGADVILEIIGPNEVFGESGLLAVSQRSEQAKVLEDARLMSWPLSVLEDLMSKRPGLAVALLQVLVRRSVDMAVRVESLSRDNTERRLARSLLHFSERLGRPEEDGTVRMMPLTHELLSSHVGTSREVVSGYMNQFRKSGYIRYTRQAIFLNREALAASVAGSGRPDRPVGRAGAKTTAEAPSPGANSIRE